MKKKKKKHDLKIVKVQERLLSHKRMAMIVKSLGFMEREEGVGALFLSTEVLGFLHWRSGLQESNSA